jgi:hypothetical protein
MAREVPASGSPLKIELATRFPVETGHFETGASTRRLAGSGLTKKLWTFTKKRAKK